MDERKHTAASRLAQRAQRWAVNQARIAELGVGAMGVFYMRRRVLRLRGFGELRARSPGVAG